MSEYVALALLTITTITGVITAVYSFVLMGKIGTTSKLVTDSKDGILKRLSDIEKKINEEEKEHIHRENRAGKERDSIAGGITRVIGGVEDVGKGMESLIKKIDEGGK